MMKNKKEIFMRFPRADEVTDIGMESIGEAIEKMTSLRSVSLDVNG